MSNLLDTLLSLLADHYQVERELRGGGMSRVFVATESVPVAASWRNVTVASVVCRSLSSMGRTRAARHTSPPSSRP